MRTKGDMIMEILFALNELWREILEDAQKQPDIDPLFVIDDPLRFEYLM
jgi:hypothetical protein